MTSSLHSFFVPLSLYCPSAGSLLGAEGVHGLHQVQGQTVLGVVLWQHLDQSADQPATLGQRYRRAPQLAGVLEEKKT